MSTLDRYRKSGGFLQLVMLIEAANKEKQEKFLALIAEESSNWEWEVRKKVLTIDRVFGWNVDILSVVFNRIPANAVGAAIFQLPREKQIQIKSALAHLEQKKVETFLADNKPTPGEIFSCYVRIYAEIRALVADGTLKFEKFDPEMVISKDIEQKLDTATLNVEFEQQKTHISPIAVTDETMAEGVTVELQKKINLLFHENHRLNQENQNLKSELNSLRDKLERIRKIA